MTTIQPTTPVGSRVSASPVSADGSPSPLSFGKGGIAGTGQALAAALNAGVAERKDARLSAEAQVSGFAAALTSVGNAAIGASVSLCPRPLRLPCLRARVTVVCVQRHGPQPERPHPLRHLRHLPCPPIFGELP